MEPMDLSALTEETLQAVTKAVTAGLLANTGLAGIDLLPLVSLEPVVTPWRNSIGRESSPNGAKFAQWRSLLNVNNSQPSPFIGYDNAANLVTIDEQDVFSNYFPVAEAGRVTQDAIDIAKGYADAQAIATLHTLNQCIIQENRGLIGGLNYALGTPAAPTVTTATTGGSIAASTAVPVRVAARSGANHYWGGSTLASPAGTVTTGAGTATSTVTASIAAVKAAVSYDWYVNGFYYTTTFTASVTITSVPVAHAALPKLPNLYTGAAITALPAADTSAPKDIGGNLSSFNGVLAAVLADYTNGGPLVKNGTGDTPSGATFIDAGASTLTLSGGSISQIDALLQGIWDATGLSPSTLWMASAQATDISRKVLGSPGATVFLEPTANSGRRDAVAGGWVGHVINAAAGGAVVDIKVDPHWPNGTMLARTDSIPYSGANIDRAFKVRTLRDYARYDYGTAYAPTVVGGGPRQDFEVRSLETLVSQAPAAQGVMANIAAG